ncbi:MAG: hypothetical protein KC431_28735 [Myxococcales bacterium]|nr:hypothetical protein [Myxococcales bacterium]
MTIKRATQGERPSIASHHARRQLRLAAITLAVLSGLFGPPVTAGAFAGICGGSYDPSVNYPQRPDLRGPDFDGQAQIVVHVEEERAVAEIDGCFFDLGGEPIEVEFGSLDQVSVVLELHGELAEASVVVVEDGHWIDTIAASASVAFEMTSTMDLDLVITGTGPMAPTVPVVIRKPIEGDPEPS